MTNEKAVKTLDLNLILRCHNEDLRNWKKVVILWAYANVVWQVLTAR